MADIGITCETKPVYVAWVVRLYKENAAVDPNLDLVNYYIGQGKFLEFYAKPMMAKMQLLKHVKFPNKFVEQFSANVALITAHNQALGTDKSKRDHIGL